MLKSINFGNFSIEKTMINHPTLFSSMDKLVNGDERSDSNDSPVVNPVFLLAGNCAFFDRGSVDRGQFLTGPFFLLTGNRDFLTGGQLTGGHFLTGVQFLTGGLLTGGHLTGGQFFDRSVFDRWSQRSGTLLLTGPVTYDQVVR